MWSSAREKIPSDPVVGRVWGDGRQSGTVQTENTVRHTKYGRIRGMVVDEGGCSTGVLLYLINLIHPSIPRPYLPSSSFILSSPVPISRFPCFAISFHILSLNKSFITAWKLLLDSVMLNNNVSYLSES